MFSSRRQEQWSFRRWPSCVQHSRLTNLTLVLNSTSIRRPRLPHGRWKCTGDRESAMLQNRIAEYHVLDYIKPAYKKELIMDYRMLNQYVDIFMADNDVYTSKFCEWRQHGSNVSLQVWISESLWPFQTVVYADKCYCPTRLSFGLNAALQIMKAILSYQHTSMTFRWMKTLYLHCM